ncbi:MAG: amidase family protein, partial [Dehalococcoidia bacterium]
VVEASPPEYDGLFARLGASLRDIVADSRVAQVRWLEERAGHPLREGDVTTEVLRAAEYGATLSDARIAEASEHLAAEMHAPLGWWDDFDVFVSPVLRQRPWPLGTLDGGQTGGLFVTPPSFTGQPSMSLPLHWSDDGLPVGVQFVGRVDADRTLLALAGDLERAFPWADRWPPRVEA